MTTKTVKLAIFERKDSEYRSEYIMEVTDWNTGDETEYLLLSDIQEATFHYRDETDVILEKVEALRIKKTRMNAEIDEQISKLLALPNPEDFGVTEEDKGGAR